MANLNTPVSATETKKHLEESSRNPTTKVGGGATTGQTVHLSLRFTGGQTITPKEIYEMVDAKFGTVASTKGSNSRGTYIFQIES